MPLTRNRVPAPKIDTLGRGAHPWSPGTTCAFDPERYEGIGALENVPMILRIIAGILIGLALGLLMKQYRRSRSLWQ